MVTRLDALYGLSGSGKLNLVIHVFKFYFRLNSVCVYYIRFVVRRVASATLLTTKVLLSLDLNLLVTLNDIAHANVVVRLDVKTTILTYGNLLNIVLETTQ